MRRAAPLLALLALAAPAAAEDRAPEGVVHVVGRARSETPPDFASVEIGVETRGPTPAAALDAASEAARRMIALATEFGIAEGEIGTTAVSLQPVTRSVRAADGTMTERPDGYRAANQVRLRLADMARLGDLMRRSLDAGANRIDGVGFGLKDPDAVEAAARVAAMRDATAQAARLAEASGRRLGPPIAIESPPREGRPVLPYAAAPMRAKASGGARVPLVAGTIETGAEVAASFVLLAP